MNNDISFILMLLNNNNVNTYVIILIILYPYLKGLFEIYIYSKIKKIFNCFNIYNKIKIVANNSIKGTINTYDYPEPFLAICYHLNESKLCQNMKYFDSSVNKLVWYSFYRLKNSETPEKDNYIIEDTDYDLDLGDNILLEINKYNENIKDDCSVTTINMILKSKTKKTNEIQNYIQKCIEKYREALKKKTSNKMYHFIYQGCQKDDKTGMNLVFSENIISDLNDEKNKNYETFDCIYHEHKDSIIKSIDRLNNLEYYKKFGLKRKKGYLFYGHSGCGKTSTTMAIANYCKRHIIEIPLIRVATNLEMEKILNLNSINGVEFKKDEVLYLFDEIDMAGKCIEKRNININKDTKDTNNTNDTNDNKNEDDLTGNNLLYKLLTTEKSNDPHQLNLGTLLSRLDGIGNYSGLIFIATTNCKEKLDPALFRHGRLEPLYFTYCRKIDLKNIIEHFFGNKLTDQQIEKLPEKKLSPASLIKYIEDYENNIDGLLEFLYNF